MDEPKKKRRAERTTSPEAMFLRYPIAAAAEAPPEPDKEPREEANQEQKAQVSPLDNAGPMPAELLRDPYAIELVPITSDVPPVVTRAKFFNQERLVWMSAVTVSWVVTAVAVLRALHVI